jgi:hypothetical protein
MSRKGTWQMHDAINFVGGFLLRFHVHFSLHSAVASSEKQQ